MSGANRRMLGLAKDFIRAQGGTVQHTPRDDRAAHAAIASQQRFHCDVCPRTDRHIHCPECGSTEHVASECDMEG